MLAAVCGRLIEKMLFGVRPLDLATFVFVTIVLGITAALSIVGPAWRAARIDPAVALRNTVSARRRPVTASTYPSLQTTQTVTGLTANSRWPR